MELETLYLLRDDKDKIAAVQKATLPVLEAVGRISRVYWGSMGDWPEFELTSAEGERSTWTRLGDHSRYVEGLTSRVKYVLQMSRSRDPRIGEMKLVLEVAVEPSDERSSRYPPGPVRDQSPPWQSSEYLDSVRSALREHDAHIKKGLSEAEVEAIEDEFGFRFPPDLRFLLQAFLPQGKEFPDWRSSDRQALHERLDWPADGIAFDVVEADFWDADWGERPRDDEAAAAIARRVVSLAPRLIPIYSHRYIPSEPYGDGNPVLSVYQTDIVCYGADLAEYFGTEFAARMPYWSAPSRRPIRFWDRLVS